MMNHLGMAGVGAAIGYQTGDTKEEKLKNAVLGAMIGLGGSMAPSVLVHISESNPEMFDKVMKVAAELQNPSQPGIKTTSLPEPVTSSTFANHPEIINEEIHNQGNLSQLLNNQPNAIQIPGSGPLDVRPSPGNGQGVGQQNPVGQGAPQEGVPQPRLLKTPQEVEAETRFSPEYKVRVQKQIQTVLKAINKSPSVDIGTLGDAARLIQDHTGLTPDQFKKISENDQPISVLEGLRNSR